MHLNRTLVRIAIVFAFALQIAPLWAAPAPTVPGVVNVNTADASQLAQLPRVGPALAERIVAYRKENGELKKASDLILVRGIGEKTFRLLEPFVVVEGKTTLSRKLRTADAEMALSGREDAKPNAKPQSAAKSDGSQASSSSASSSAASSPGRQERN